MAVIRKESKEIRSYFIEPEGAIRGQEFNNSVYFLGIRIYSKDYSFSASMEGEKKVGEIGFIKNKANGSKGNN